MARTLGDAFVRIRPDATTFGPELNAQVSGAQRSFGSKLGGFAKAAGVALGAAGAYGAVQFMKGAVELEAEFGRTMNVLKANTGAPKAEMRALSDLAMKMGQDTVFSAGDAADAMLAMAKNGIKPAEIRAGALKQALTLAAAGGVDMERAADIMSNALNTFNLEARDSAKVSAALAGAANASSASIDDIALGLQQAGTVAADAGFSISETTGAIAALANAGIKGSDAGTSMKTMFANLVPQTTKAREAMQQYGLVNFNANGMMRELRQDGIEPTNKSLGAIQKAVGEYLVQQGAASKGTEELAEKTQDYMYVTGGLQNAFLKQNGEYRNLTSIAGTLQKRLGGLSASERATALNTIFGSDARRAATILMREGEKGLARYIKATRDQGAAQRMADAQMKGTAGALEQMRGSVETAQLAWGRAQKPLITFGALMVTEIANGAVPIIEKMGGAFRRFMKGDSPEKMLNGVKGAMKGINWNEAGSGARKLAQSMGELGPGLKEAKDELPTLADGFKVAGVVVRFLANHLDTLAALMPVLASGFIIWKVAQAAANVAAAASVPVRIAEVFATRAQTRALIQHRGALQVATGAQAVNTAATSAGTKMTIRQRIAAVASAAAQKAVAVATKAWAVAQRILNAAMRANPIGIVITVIAALAAGLIYAYKKSETFRRIVNTAWSMVKRGAQAVWNWLKDNLIPFFTKTIPDAFRTVVDWVKQNWDMVLLLAGPIGAAVLVVKRNWGRIKDAFSAAWQWIKDKVLSPIKDFLTDTLPDAFGRGVNAIKTVWERLKEVARKPVEFVVNTVYNNGIRRMVNAIPGVPDLPELHFAEGGPVPGWTARAGDTLRAKLRPNEHVWTEDEVAGVPGGHHGVKRMRELAKRRRLGKLGDPGWDLAPGFAGGGFPMEVLQRAINWANAQAGKPYIWGGTGPGGYDCSGFMSGIANVLSGGDGVGTRYGTTATFPWPGFKPGWGEFTIGNSKQYGHMGGTLAGLEVESTNGSVRTGPIARGAGDPLYSERYHLGASGAKYASGGGSAAGAILDAIKTVKEVVGNIAGWFSQLMEMGGFGKMVRDMAKAVANNVAQWLNDKIPDWGPIPNDPIPTFDRGGKARGRGMLLKDTLRAERMLSPEETASYDQIGALIRELRSGRRRPVRLVVDGREFRAYLEEVADEAVELAADFQDHYSRGGR